MGWVYFVRCPLNGHIKIGYTGGPPEKRLGDPRKMSPVPLEPKGLLPGGFDLERQLHVRFREYRHHGEWFRPNPELREFVEEETQPWPDPKPRRRTYQRRAPDPADVLMEQHWEEMVAADRAGRLERMASKKNGRYSLVVEWRYEQARRMWLRGRKTFAEIGKRFGVPAWVAESWARGCYVPPRPDEEEEEAEEEVEA